MKALDQKGKTSWTDGWTGGQTAQQYPRALLCKGELKKLNFRYTTTEKPWVKKLHTLKKKKTILQNKVLGFLTNIVFHYSTCPNN